jgi:hypothetical protein
MDIQARKNEYNELTIQKLYENTHYGTNYIKANYKQAIQVLLKGNAIKLFDKKQQETTKITYTAKIKFT